MQTAGKLTKRQDKKNTKKIANCRQIDEETRQKKIQKKNCFCLTSKRGAKVNISDKPQWKLCTSYCKSKLEERMQLDPENEELFLYVDFMFYNGFHMSLLPSTAAVGSSSGGSSGRKRTLATGSSSDKRRKKS